MQDAISPSCAWQIPMLIQRWEEEEEYVTEAFAFHKQQWERRR